MTKNILYSTVILDDHLIFAESFSLLLERSRLFESVHSYRDTEKLLDFLVHYQSKNLVLFLDYYLSEGNSTHLINEIKRINKHISIVILSSLSNPIIIQHLLKHHISGIISKSSGTEIIIECIQNMHENNKYICPIMKQLCHEAENTSIGFTDREMQILQLFAKGFSIAQTAEITFLSKHTIVAHRRKMMSKANCSSIIELLAYSRKMGFI